MRILRWVLVSHHEDPERAPYEFDRCLTHWGAELAARQMNLRPPHPRCWMAVWSAREWDDYQAL